MAGDIYVSFGAETGELEAAMAKTKAEVSALGRELTQTAREMQKSGADMDSALGQSLTALGAKLAEAKAHMAELRRELRESGKEGGLKGLIEGLTRPLESIEAIKGSLAGMAELVAGAFAVEKIADFVGETAEAAEKNEHLAQVFGLTVEQIQRFRASANLAGVDGDELVHSMARLELQLAKVHSATSPVGAALKALGIDVQEFRGLGFEEQINVLAEAFSRFADGPGKAAAAMAIFRGVGDQLIPFFNRGKEGLAELNKEVDKTGVVMDKTANADMAHLAEEEKDLQTATQALSQDIGISLSKAAADAVGWMTKLAEAIDQALKASRAWASPPLITGADFSAPADIPVLDPSGAQLNQALSGGRTINVNARKPPVPQFDVGGAKGGGSDSRDTDAVEAVRDAFREAIQDAKESEDATKESLAEQLKGHKITWDRWAQQSGAALKEEAAEITEAGAQAVASDLLTAHEKLQVARETQQAIAQINKQMAADSAKAAEEDAKAWQTAVQTIAAPFEHMLTGMLEQHKSFASEAKSAFESLANSIIGNIEKMIVKWIALKAVETFGGLSGLGPVGSLIGGALGIASFDVGSWSLPSTQLAVVHQGEMIVPAGQSDWARGVLSGQAPGPGGGAVSIHPTTNVNISAVDGPSVSSWMRQNGSDMLKGIDAAVRSGAALGAKRLRF